MPLVLFGLNHDSAPLKVRELVALSDEDLPAALKSLIARPEIEEAAILSTCNRTEIYCNTDAPHAILHWLQHFRGVTPDEAHFYTKTDEEALRHLFRVASGLDSMVLGEAQILGQVKHAARVAQEEGTLGWLLHRALQHSFNVAKWVRTETSIGTESVSMATALLRVSVQVLGPMANQRVLLIGAGEMIALVATHLGRHAPKSLTIANRTLERGRAIAERFQATVIPLSEIALNFGEYDLVVASTASPLPIIGKGLVERAIKLRRHRPMVLVDLAVPRDIEPEVGAVEDVFLYTVDDLGRLIEAGQAVRQRAALEAKDTIDQEVADFRAWVNGRALVPVIRQLRAKLDTYRQAELERAKRLLQGGESPELVLEQLSMGLMNKFLHHPTQVLQAADPREHGDLLQCLPKLFPLSDGE